MTTTTKTAVVKVTEPVAGDTITISDARGVTYSFELATQEFARTCEDTVSVQIGSPEKTANNLFRKVRPLLAIMGTVSPDGVLSLTQDEAGPVKDIETTGNSFLIVSQWT